jgi:hypothetical protein
MCQWGTEELVRVWIPADLSHDGKGYYKVVGIDACITSIVKALNDAGIVTRASCCGHGKRPGNIALADGRELIIALDYETGRTIDRAFPPISAEAPSIYHRQNEVLR